MKLTSTCQGLKRRALTAWFDNKKQPHSLHPSMQPRLPPSSVGSPRQYTGTCPQCTNPGAGMSPACTSLLLWRARMAGSALYTAQRLEIRAGAPRLEVTQCHSLETGSLNQGQDSCPYSERSVEFPSYSGPCPSQPRRILQYIRRYFRKECRTLSPSQGIHLGFLQDFPSVQDFLDFKVWWVGRFVRSTEDPSAEDRDSRSQRHLKVAQVSVQRHVPIFSG